MSAEHEPTTRSFRPGPWFGIFGEHATVLLPPSEKARVAALWELVDDGAGFDETLDALIAGGLRELPGFVLVSRSEGETKVVLRGAARATFTAGGETVELAGAAATTWVERALREVTAMVIEVTDEPVTGPAHTLAGGLVRVARVEEPAPEAVDAEPVVEAPDVEPVAGAADVDPEPVVVEPGDERDSPFEPEPEPSGEPEPPTEAWSVQPAPVVPVAPVPPSPFAAPDADADPTGPVSPAPPVMPPAPGDHDHDGMTRAGGWDPGELARQHPGIPGQPPAPSVTARPVARLAFSSGETVDVDRAILVGRAPEARRFTSTEQPRLVTVPSPHQEISSTHLEIRPGSGADHGSAVVTDMGSTNGTVVVQPGLPPEDLKAGIAVQLIPGAIIDLGDGVSIAVSNP